MSETKTYLPIRAGKSRVVEHVPHERVRGAHWPFVRINPKIGRNDPCPCESGKKFKKCCGRDVA